MMNQTWIWGYLFVAIVLANLPWFSQRLLLIKRMDVKRVWLRLIEWLFYGFITLMLGWLLEWQLTGDVKAQDWEFFVSVLFMFSIMSFPGMIWFMRHKRDTNVVAD